MLKPGTVCLLIAPHALAGLCCTVIALSRGGRTYQSMGVPYSTDAHEIYEIDVRDPRPVDAGIAGALRSELVPLAPPPLKTDTPIREKVEA